MECRAHNIVLHIADTQNKFYLTTVILRCPFRNRHVSVHQWAFLLKLLFSVFGMCPQSLIAPSSFCSHGRQTGIYLLMSRDRPVHTWAATHSSIWIADKFMYGQVPVCKEVDSSCISGMWMNIYVPIDK